ncbi:hypothetical protein [Micromonospora tulbaghiae]
MLPETRRLLAVGGAAVALLLTNAVAAHAGLGDPVNCTANPTNPACVIQIGTPGGSEGGGGSGSSGCRNGAGETIPCYIKGKGWLGESYCYWQKATGDDLKFAEALGGKVDPPAYWYVGSCGDPITNFWPAGLILYRVYDSNPGLQLLVQEAIRHLNLPAPRIRLNPAPPAPQVVYVPTWLWIDDAVWSPRSATASLAGLSVTAVGTPTTVTWSTGDGGTKECGQGTAWKAGTDPRKASPDCGHTYTSPSRGSSGGTYTVTATITWRITWSGGGTSGSEPDLTSTASVPVQVLEASAVNTKS